MKHRIARVTLALAGSSLLVAACGSIDLLPFSGGKEQDTSRPPPGATAYTCAGNSRLFVRYLDNGAAAWVILPEREFRLNKAAAAGGTRYTNGSAALELKDNEVTLFDGEKLTHTGCKASGG